MTSTHSMMSCHFSTVLITSLQLCVFNILINTQLVTSTSSPEHKELVRFDHFLQPYHKRYLGILNVHLLEAGTSTLKVSWQLLNVTSADSLIESTAICETNYGAIVSDKLKPGTSQFQFHHLDSNTDYAVCVYVLEKSASTNISLLHYSCQSFKTIPLVRQDSVVAVVISVGYVMAMILLGLIGWWKNSYKVRQRKRKEEALLRFNKDHRNENSKRQESGKVSHSFGIGEVVHEYKTSTSCIPMSCVKPEVAAFQYNAHDREITF
ncbi:hypothetical protein BgiMline_028664 [Biomphalaria glabrata]|nr:hypothetical protein BgiBS90_032772 [Biomphalaria glabrata]KAI8753886.1 hypothetical protein BgiMline_014441 [Biomphalaria glabrata]